MFVGAVSEIVRYQRRRQNVREQLAAIVVQVKAGCSLGRDGMALNYDPCVKKCREGLPGAGTCVCESAMAVDSNRRGLQSSTEFDAVEASRGRGW
jgi:hypothetical protein